MTIYSNRGPALEPLHARILAAALGRGKSLHAECIGLELNALIQPDCFRSVSALTVA